MNTDKSTSNDNTKNQQPTTADDNIFAPIPTKLITESDHSSEKQGHTLNEDYKPKK